MCALRLADRGLDGFWENFKFFLITFIFGLVVMILSCFFVVNWKDGLIFLCCVLFLLYLCVQAWTYVRNDYRFTPLG